MKKAKFLFLFIFFVSSIFFYPAKSQANLWEQQDMLKGEVAVAFGESHGNPRNLISQITRIINMVLTTLGIIVVCLILFAGFKWMTAGGNEENVKDAKKILLNSVIGLLIIIFAWSITTFILQRLSKKCISPTGVHIPDYCK